MKILLLLILVCQSALAVPKSIPTPSPTPVVAEGFFTGEEKWIAGERYRAFQLPDGTILWLIESPR